MCGVTQVKRPIWQEDVFIKGLAAFPDFPERPVLDLFVVF